MKVSAVFLCKSKKITIIAKFHALKHFLFFVVYSKRMKFCAKILFTFQVAFTMLQKFDIISAVIYRKKGYIWF